MDEEVETPKVLEELSRKNDAGAGGGSERQRRGGSGWLVVFLLLIPLLAGAALLGYQQWTLYLRLNSLATANNRLMESIQASDARLAELEASSGQQVSASPADQASVDVLRQEFSSRLEQLDLVINELSNRSLSPSIEDDGRVQLAEAEHLLRIANRHLQLTEDVATVTVLLENADQLLLDSGDSRVVQAREALARDLGRLRNVKEVDVDGLYLRLTALRESVEELDIAISIGASYQQQLAQAREQRNVVSTEEQSGSLLDSGLNFFSSIFVWREWDDTPDIAQPSRELVTVKQTVNLMLEQSQLSLLTRRWTVYRQNLQRARDLIQSHGAASEQAVSQVLSELDNMLADDLAAELPDISQSLRLVRQLNSRPPVSVDVAPR